MGIIDVFAQSVEIDGYKFSPLTLADWAEFSLYYKYLPVKEAEFATRNFPPALQREILAEAYSNCKCKKLKYVNPEDENDVIEGDVSFEHPEVQAFVQNPVGLLYLCYLSIKHQQPDITLEQMEKIGTEDFIAKFYALLIADGDTPNDDENPPK